MMARHTHFCRLASKRTHAWLGISTAPQPPPGHVARLVSRQTVLRSSRAGSVFPSLHIESPDCTRQPGFFTTRQSFSSKKGRIAVAVFVAEANCPTLAQCFSSAPKFRRSRQHEPHRLPAVRSRSRMGRVSGWN